MKVLKFGGTTIGTAEGMRLVADLVAGSGKGNVVVLSALSGTTRALSEIADYYMSGNADGALDAVARLEERYRGFVAELFAEDACAVGKKSVAAGASDKGNAAAGAEGGKAQWSAGLEARRYLDGVFGYLRSFSREIFGVSEQRLVVAQGELMATEIFALLLCGMGMEPCRICALDFMKVNGRGEPDQNHIRERLEELMRVNPGAEVYLTQGFICRNLHGEVDNLGRGSSDYSASLIAAALGAEEVRIWTRTDDVAPVAHLHFDEAAELGYFGAKMLHPTCIQPAKFAGIPVRLLNTAAPQAAGTLIDNVLDAGRIKAVAAKDNITAISIRSSRMLLAHGFLRKVFEIFESYHTPIDMICTSEVGVSLSIDNTTHLGEIVHDLKKYGTVSVDLDMCIVCVVGDMNWNNRGFEARAAMALSDIPVRMISYGGSNFNISFLIREEDKDRALESLNSVLFGDGK